MASVCCGRVSEWCEGLGLCFLPCLGCGVLFCVCRLGLTITAVGVEIRQVAGRNAGGGQRLYSLYRREFLLSAPPCVVRR